MRVSSFSAARSGRGPPCAGTPGEREFQLARLPLGRPPQPRRKLPASARRDRGERLARHLAPPRQALHRRARQARAVEMVVERADPHPRHRADVAHRRPGAIQRARLLDRLARMGQRGSASILFFQFCRHCRACPGNPFVSAAAGDRSAILRDPRRRDRAPSAERSAKRSDRPQRMVDGVELPPADTSLGRAKHCPREDGRSPSARHAFSLRGRPVRDVFGIELFRRKMSGASGRWRRALNPNNGPAAYAPAPLTPPSSAPR